MSLSPALDLVLRYVPSVPYLWGKFKFATDQAAPLTSPYTESGAVGSLTLVQTDGQLSTSGGKLVFPAQATPADGDLGLYSATSVARQAGRVLLSKILWNQNNTQAPLFWSNAAAAQFTTANAHREEMFTTYAGVNTNTFYVYGGPSASDQVNVGAMATATEYEVAIVLRGTGAFYLIKGGAFTNWTLLWVTASRSTTPLYPAWACFDATGTLDDFRGADLPAPWNSDYGVATQRLAGARTTGDTFTHTADCLLEFTATTLPSASAINFRFRMTDANNRWTVTVDSVGTLTLFETAAGTTTQRGATASGTVSNGHRIVVVAEGTTIKLYSNNTLRITYASASSGQTNTAGELNSLGTGGAVSDLIAWPRTPAFPSAY